MTRRQSKEAYQEGQAIRQAFNDCLAALAIGAGLLVILFLS
jgi:hypothetical protein